EGPLATLGALLAAHDDPLALDQLLRAPAAGHARQDDRERHLRQRRHVVRGHAVHTARGNVLALGDDLPVDRLLGGAFQAHAEARMRTRGAPALGTPSAPSRRHRLCLPFWRRELCRSDSSARSHSPPGTSTRATTTPTEA